MDLKHEIIFGRHSVEELLKSGKPIAKIFVHNKLSGLIEVQIRQTATKRGIPLVRTEIESLNRMAGGRNHQGVVAATSPIEFQDLNDIIPFLFEQNMSPLIVILDHIKDVRNFGGIARSAEVFGAHAIIIPKNNTAAINNDAVKTSSGSLLNIPVCRISKLTECIELLQNSGIQVFSSDIRAEKKIFDLDMTGPTAVILGAEQRGVQRELSQMSDDSFLIPQFGSTDSLNVSVSAGIILYEITRQRG